MNKLPCFKSCQNSRSAPGQVKAPSLREHFLTRHNIYPRSTRNPRHKDRKRQARLAEFESHVLRNNFTITNPQTRNVAKAPELARGEQINWIKEFSEKNLNGYILFRAAGPIHLRLPSNARYRVMFGPAKFSLLYQP